MGDEARTILRGGIPSLSDVRTVLTQTLHLDENSPEYSELLLRTCSKLIDSKHIGTHRGGHFNKDLIASAYHAHIPDMRARQGQAHQASLSKLSTMVEGLRRLLRTRIYQLSRGEVRRDLLIRDMKEEIRKAYF